MTDNTYLKIPLLVTLLFLSFLIRFVFLHASQIDTPDEKTYFRYQSQINESGLLAGIRKLVAEYNQDKDSQLFPMPTRFGHSGLLSLTTRILGDEITSLKYFSLICSTISALLILLIAYRLLGIFGAYVASLCYSLFLPSLLTSVRGWGEALIELLFLLIFISGFLIFRQNRVFSWQSLPYFVFGVFAFFVKESALLVLFLCSLLPFFSFLLQRKYKELSKLILLATAIVVIAFTTLAYVVGGWDVLMETYKNHKFAHSHNPYAISFQSGEWYDFFLLLYVLSPGSCLCFCLVLLLPYLEMKAKVFSSRPKLIYPTAGLLTFLFFFILACSINPYSINLRLFSPIFGFMSLLLSIPLIVVIDYSLSAKKTWLFLGLNSFFVLCLFLNLFVAVKFMNNPRCQDLSIKLVRECVAVSH